MDDEDDTMWTTNLENKLPLLLDRSLLDPVDFGGDSYDEYVPSLLFVPSLTDGAVIGNCTERVGARSSMKKRASFAAKSATNSFPLSSSSRSTSVRSTPRHSVIQWKK